MTMDGAGRAPQLTAGTQCAPDGQEAAILPSVPGEFRARLRSRPASPSGLERGCRGRPHSIPRRGREERRDRGLQGLGTVGAAPGVGKRSAGRTPTWDCSDAPRLDTALHTSGGGEGLWTCGCPLVPLLSSLSLFFWGRNLRISMRRPQGEGQLGPYTSPCHISVPVGIKKEQNPKTGGVRGFHFLGGGGGRSTGVFRHSESAENRKRFTHSPPWAMPEACRSAQVPAAAPSPLTFSQDRRRLRQRPWDRWRDAGSGRAETLGGKTRKE